MPKFPPTATFFPACFKISPIRVVTVDFPFVPVTAMIGVLVKRKASSISLIIWTPRLRDSSKNDALIFTPGLRTIKSEDSGISEHPNSVRTLGDNERRFFSNSTRDLMSTRTTEASLETRKFDVATPVHPAPTTVIFLFFSNIIILISTYLS